MKYTLSSFSKLHIFISKPQISIKKDTINLNGFKYLSSNISPPFRSNYGIKRYYSIIQPWPLIFQRQGKNNEWLLKSLKTMGFQHIEVLRYNETKRSLLPLQNREYLPQIQLPLSSLVLPLHLRSLNIIFFLT